MFEVKKRPDKYRGAFLYQYMGMEKVFKKAEKELANR